ncbi:redoxin domain-containing protein [Rhodohalobacter mucosus]|uniref:Peroxiredoxin n=1 Tax=Rhodohalobacter mucosus TaxID=2079485 RepID=A0A316U2N5_9BACT|nr:redoxin domain-containing protein [Rhodohalobacter mucosus]PWN07556.1 peroxiredoxin [Rhodohalobacter mucosus]
MTLKTGDTVEDFSLQNTEGKPVALSELIGEDRVVLLFFPLAFSGVCTEELCSTRDNMKMFNSLNANVAAISADSFFTLREYKKVNNLNFELLSDFNKEVSAQFNSLYEEYFGMKGVPKRSAFVINSNMQIEHMEILEDSDRIPDFQEIINVLSGS